MPVFQSRFPTHGGLNLWKKKLETMHPGILKSLELERIKLFPKVRRRIENEGLVANKGISCIEA